MTEHTVSKTVGERIEELKKEGKPFLKAIAQASQEKHDEKRKERFARKNGMIET